MRETSRRSVLRSIPVFGITTVSGCTSILESSQRRPSEERQATTTGQPAATASSTPARSETTTPETETSAETTEKTPEPPDHYRIDVIEPDEQPRTEREWDDFRHDPARIQDRVEEWNRYATYNRLVTKLERDADLDGNPVSIRYPNWSDGDYGHWDLSAFRATKDAETLLHWGSAALQVYQLGVTQGAASTENDHFAATLDRIINDLYRPDSDKRYVETGYVDQGGHGTVFAYVNTSDTRIEGENWFWIDTTNVMVSTLDGAPLSEGFNPFVQGYKPEAQTERGYTDEKDRAENALASLIDPSHGVEQFNHSKISFTDEILDSIYNTHIRRKNRHVDPIRGIIEVAADFQIETGEYVQIYRERLDDVRFAASGRLYKMSMDPSTHLTTERVEEFLAT